ncbi:MAG: hypothetical protein VCA55_10275, partial [Verrucomicrobiales bacterium]
MSAIAQLLRKPLAFVSGEYGMAAVLLLLAVFFSILTIEERSPEGSSAGRKLAKDIFQLTEDDPVNFPKDLVVFIAAGENKTGRAFAGALEDGLLSRKITVTGKGIGSPARIRKAMEQSGTIDLIATASSIKKFPVFDA